MNSHSSLESHLPARTLRLPTLIQMALDENLVFRPVPPGDLDAQGQPRLVLTKSTVTISVTDNDWQTVLACLARGALALGDVTSALKPANISDGLKRQLNAAVKAPADAGWSDQLDRVHLLDQMALVAVRLIDSAQRSLLKEQPLTEIHFKFDEKARAALALCWEAMTKRGSFPLPPEGNRRFVRLNEHPCGAMHFVSASDLDAGYYYTMGVALSPEAQALQTMDLTFGLDGELIVPGQAVSPIPPFLSMATRLFAASIPTSSNISEEVHAIPMRNFPHPSSIDDLEPRRGGLLRPPVRPSDEDAALADLWQQILRHDAQKAAKKTGPQISATATSYLPDVAAVYEVTGMNRREVERNLARMLAEPGLAKRKKSIALYLNIEPSANDRVAVINEVVDAAARLGLSYVAIADDVEDTWLPGLLEYLEADELNEVADYADKRKVLLIDGRPTDATYTAATAAQRIQSVYSTLSVDILKMGMWLCLDALTARAVWREIVANPHIPSNMLLMPIGIVEPWSAFADNRNPRLNQRAILDPFAKIKFMIEEAKELRMPSLLTDTRHKAKWVLLGRKTDGDKPHLRERFLPVDSKGDFTGRSSGSAIPLLSWQEFMQCEQLARKAGILLGQAGSIEMEQVFHVLSETTYDAAKDRRNPATAIWTAETERVLRTSGGTVVADLQSQRSAAVSPFLATINRTVESHAKLDGWLRYLEGRKIQTPALRNKLGDLRTQLGTLLEQCLAKQKASLAEYQTAWDAYRLVFVEYHALIRKNYAPVRDQVQRAWDGKSARKTSAKS